MNGLALLLIFAGLGQLRADVMVDNLGQPTENYFGPIGSDSNTNDFEIAQEFTLPAAATPFQLNAISLLYYATGGGANLTVSIWGADSNNNPTNEIAGVGTQYLANAGVATFTPSTNVLLGPGIYYVVAAPATPADSGLIHWAYATTTNWTGPGSLENIADTIPGNWENVSVTNLPQQMSVQATPVAATLGLEQTAGVTTLFWPAALNGFVADSTTNLASPPWQALTNPPVLAAGTNTVTGTSTAPMQFFRLRQSLVAENLDQPAVGWDGPIGSDNNTNDFQMAQEFILPPGNYALTQVTLALIPAYGSGNVTVSIWSVGLDGNPASQVAVVASQLVASAGNVAFIPPAPLKLSGGAHYAVAEPTTPADNGLVGWDYTISTSWTGFGALANFASTYNGMWVNAPISQGPYQISIQATPMTP